MYKFLLVFHFNRELEYIFNLLLNKAKEAMLLGRVVGNSRVEYRYL